MSFHAFIAVVLTTSAASFAEIPNKATFVADGKTVAWVKESTGFQVTFDTETKQQVLLSGAKCKEVSNGFHCYIKPVRVPGILTTDVNFKRTAPDFFDISTLVLINGSFTGVHKIGDDFVELPNESLRSEISAQPDANIATRSS